MKIKKNQFNSWWFEFDTGNDGSGNCLAIIDIYLYEGEGWKIQTKDDYPGDFGYYGDDTPYTEHWEVFRAIEKLEGNKYPTEQEALDDINACQAEFEFTL
jgi:hypothetical protein